VSFSAGTLFGDAFLHLLPETAERYGFDATTGLFVLAGLLLGLVVEKYVFWHHEHYPRANAPDPVSYSILVGDSVHNAIDGVIIAASYLAAIPLGVATTAAVAFHEIPQEIGNFGVLVHGGFTRRRAIAYNFRTALTAFVGATAVVLVGDIEGVTRVLVPLTAGNFVYIAGSDLLPELVEETDTADSTRQFATFLAGIGLLYLLAVTRLASGPRRSRWRDDPSDRPTVFRIEPGTHHRRVG